MDTLKDEDVFPIQLSLRDRIFPPLLSSFWSPVALMSNLNVYGQPMVRLPSYALPLTTSWYQAQHRLSASQVVNLGDLANLTFEAQELPVVFFFLVMGYLPRELPLLPSPTFLFNLLDLTDFLGWIRPNLTIYGHLWSLEPKGELVSTFYLYLTRDIIKVRDQPTSFAFKLLVEILYSYPFTDQEVDAALTTVLDSTGLAYRQLDYPTLLTALRDTHAGRGRDNYFLSYVTGQDRADCVYITLNGIVSCSRLKYSEGVPRGLAALPQAQLPVKLISRPDLPFGLTQILVDSGVKPSLLWLDWENNEYPKNYNPTLDFGPNLGQLIVDYLDGKLEVEGLTRLVKLMKGAIRLVPEEAAPHLHQQMLDFLAEVENQLTLKSGPSLTTSNSQAGPWPPVRATVRSHTNTPFIPTQISTRR